MLRNTCLVGFVCRNLKVILIGCIKYGGNKSQTSFILFIYTKIFCGCVFYTWEGSFIPGKTALLQIFKTLTRFLKRPGWRHTMLSGWLFFQLTFQIDRELGYWLTILLVHNSYFIILYCWRFNFRVDSWKWDCWGKS